MPVKSIVQIEVADQAFDSFQKKFESYLGELDEQQAKWEKAGAAMGMSGEALAGGAFNAKESLAVAAAQAGIISEALADAVKAQNDLGSATKRSGEHMGSLRKNAEGVGNAIKSIGGWVVRLAAFGGIGGLLSGLGIADLAGAAFSRSKSAGGLGISTGQLTSFQVNAQQFLGMEALRSAVDVQQNAGKWGVFGALGLDIDKSRKEDPRLLAFDALGKLTARYNQDQKTGLPPGSDAIIAMGASLGITLDDIRNAAMHPGQLGRARGAMLRDDREMSNTNADLQAMIEFKKALDRAGMSIETTFIRGLAPLAPELDNLSVQFKGLIKDVLGSQTAKDSINLLAGGLHGLGVTLASDSFRHDLKRFGQDISWIVNNLKWIPIVNDKGGKILNTANAASQGAGAAAHHGIMGALDWVGDRLKVPQRTAWSMSILNKLHDPYTPENIAFLNRWQAQENTNARHNPLATTQPARGASAFNSVGVRNYLNAQQGYDATIKTLENGYYPNIVAGLRSGKPYGNKNSAAELNKWGTGSKWYNDESSHWYNGKTEIGKSILNAMIKTVDDDIKKYGKNWSSHLPKDVASFVGAHLSASERSGTNTAAINKLLKNVVRKSTPKPATVVIHNKSSANVFYSANAAAWV